MKKIFAYIAVALLTFTGILIAFAPAALLWNQVDRQALEKVPELQVTGINGTLWQGHSAIYYRQFPASQLDWEMAVVPALFAQTADATLRLDGEGHDFQAEIQANAAELEIASLKGFVDALYINRVSQPQGLTFAGRVEVQRLALKSDLRWIQVAEGEIFWPGGKIVSRTAAAGTQVFDLPALKGEITMVGDTIKLVLHPENPAQILVDIEVKPTGWVSVAVKARLFDLAGLAWPAGSSLDDTVLQFEEQLLRGGQ